jgi:serine/threonine protein kinase
MPLAANSRIGPYQITSMLGVDGMGEVYRARDPRLNRDVAVKVLRGDLAATSEQKSRFEREARAVAALNHPNIVGVFDFGIDPDAGNGGAQYIVSELIYGESLRTLIAGKPVSVRRLMDIAVQVADGLAAAHTAGIVHRDLKPENILLTKEGRVKILDFGLANRSSRTGASTAIGLDETIDLDSGQNHTNAGTILGTASYMSPEQALGKQVDSRSDQFSFGLILHEMASGKKAFARNSSVETMAAIVGDEPPPIEQKLPAPLKWIINRCLSKEPEQRYESTLDLYKDLRNLREHLSEVQSSSELRGPVPVEARDHRWKIPAVVILCTVGAALSGYLLRPVRQNFGNYRFTPFASDAVNPIWSPDGKAVAYSARMNGTYQIFLRYLNSPLPVQLTHEKHDTRPLGWSSDKSHVILLESTDTKESPLYKIYSVATVRSEPDLVMDSACEACDLARDGKTFATFAKGKDGFMASRSPIRLARPFVPIVPHPSPATIFLTRLNLASLPMANASCFLELEMGIKTKRGCCLSQREVVLLSAF